MEATGAEDRLAQHLGQHLGQWLARVGERERGELRAESLRAPGHVVHAAGGQAARRRPVEDGCEPGPGDDEVLVGGGVRVRLARVADLRGSLPSSRPAVIADHAAPSASGPGDTGVFSTL